MCSGLARYGLTIVDLLIILTHDMTCCPQVDGTFQSSVTLQSITGRGTASLSLFPQFASTSQILLDVCAEAQGTAALSVKLCLWAGSAHVHWITSSVLPKPIFKADVAGAGSGIVSNTCPELLLQKALILAFSNMVLSNDPSGWAILSLVDKVNRYVKKAFSVSGLPSGMGNCCCSFTCTVFTHLQVQVWCLQGLCEHSQ